MARAFITCGSREDSVVGMWSGAADPFWVPMGAPAGEDGAVRMMVLASATFGHLMFRAQFFSFSRLAARVPGLACVSGWVGFA